MPASKTWWGSNMNKPLPDHVWACPACFEGWQVYMINTDMNVCCKCGYKGGDVEKHRIEFCAKTINRIISDAH